MEITVKGKNFDITDSLRNHAKQKLSKTTRFSDNVMTAEVVLATERNWHVAKITLNCKGSDLHAEEKSTDMYNSIDRVVEKLERELKKQKEKESNHRSGRSVKEMPPEPAAKDGDAPAKRKSDDPYAPRIESVHRFVPPTLSVDAAVKELQSAGEEFVCFINEDNETFGLVLGKGRGYGFPEPKLG